MVRKYWDLFWAIVIDTQIMWKMSRRKPDYEDEQW